jgi:hypothetical protein
VTVNRSREVDEWFATYDNPQRELVQEVRETILATDDRVSEAIKWQAPTFMFNGNIASFYPKSKAHVSLMFHQGAQLPDPTGLLEGTGETSRVAKFADHDDLVAKTPALQGLITAWIDAHS